MPKVDYKPGDHTTWHTQDGTTRTGTVLDLAPASTAKHTSVWVMPDDPTTDERHGVQIVRSRHRNDPVPSGQWFAYRYPDIDSVAIIESARKTGVVQVTTTIAPDRYTPWSKTSRKLHHPECPDLDLTTPEAIVKPVDPLILGNILLFTDREPYWLHRDLCQCLTSVTRALAENQ